MALRQPALADARRGYSRLERIGAHAAHWALYGLLALHVLGAMRHQIWDHEPELQRMMS